MLLWWKGLARWKAGERKGVGLMEVFAKYEARDTITDREQVLLLRQAVGAHIQRLFETGKVKASGAFADERGGFFVLDVASSDELFELFAPIVDYARIETHPVSSVEKVGEFFEKDAAAGG
jgi:uncharacterized protein YciI